MRKKIIILILSIATLLLTLAVITGCDLFKDEEETDDTTYTIMYSDGNETKTLTVKYGELYSISKPLPQKTGYTFLGLYDAEVGGTQYVNSSGTCVSAFTDRKNIVLFPQFETKILTFGLDYGYAPTGMTESFTVEYGQVLPMLPGNLIAQESEKYIFEGWYTQPNRQGTMVAGANGVSTVTADKFDSGDSDTVTLYAGFSIVQVNVTFYDCKDFTTQMSEYITKPIVTKKVDYGSKVSDVAPATRKNGQKILDWVAGYAGYGNYWSTIDDTGIITQDISYCVSEYGITVSYDTDGGSSVSPTIVSNINSGSFNLPSSSKSCYRLTGWRYNNETYSVGDTFIAPANDVTLKAVWIRTAYLVRFSASPSNVSVSSREVEIGDSFTLPDLSTTYQGCKFDGWVYNGRKYSGSFTPTSDCMFTALWQASASLKVQNCADNNGYDPTYQAVDKDNNNDDRLRHEGFEIVRLTVGGSQINSNGEIIGVSSNPSLKFEVMEDLDDLPRSTASSDSNSNHTKSLAEDSWEGSVYGTNISGKKIGYGAYYLKITYRDGSYDTLSDTNFLAGKNKGDIINIDFTSSGKTIRSIEVVVVYELNLHGQTVWPWWWDERSNFRCSATLNFS